MTKVVHAQPVSQQKYISFFFDGVQKLVSRRTEGIANKGDYVQE
jgi:hypothetical protein